MRDNAGSGAARAHLTTALVFGGIALAIAVLSALTGAAWQARRSNEPPPPRVRVMDINRLIEPLAADLTLTDEERADRARALSLALGAAVAAEVATGAIVLDAAAVYAAPDDAYVRP